MTDRRDAPWDEQGTEPDTEQLLAEWFAEEAPTREPAVVAPNVIARTALTRRRSRWFVRDWWRHLFRLHRWPPLTPAVAATGAAAIAVLVLIVLILPTNTAEQPVIVPIPADAIVVSIDDPGKTPTIGEAIALAEDGDTVAILPGRYRENLVIDKDITLLGAGERDAIVLEPETSDEPIILIDGGDPIISGFTVSGVGNSVQIVASEAVIEDMVFRDVGDQWWAYNGAAWDGLEDASPSILVELFADVIIRDSRFIGGGEIEVGGSSTALIEGNELVEGAAIFLKDASDDTVVRGNSITDSGLYSIESTSAANLLISGNVIVQEDPGIAIQAMQLLGTIEGNEIRGANVGIQLGDGASPTIIDNIIDTDGVALEIVSTVEPVITDNELCGKNAILGVRREAAPVSVSGNTLCEGVPLIFE